MSTTYALETLSVFLLPFSSVASFVYNSLNPTGIFVSGVSIFVYRSI